MAIAGLVLVVLAGIGMLVLGLQILIRTMKKPSIALLLAALPLAPLLGCQKAAGAGADVDRLIGQLKDPAAGKRQEAAFSLGNKGPAAKAAVAALGDALRDTEYGVRGSAAQALGRIGPDAAPAAPTLVQVMQKDSSASARGYAASALGQIGPGAKSAVPALMEALSDKDTVEEAAEALQALGEGGAAAQRLTAIVKDAAALPEKRAAAIMGLKKAGDRKEAVSLMISIIEDKTAPQELQRAATLAVGHIGFEGGEEAKAAVPALLANLDRKGVVHSGPWSLWALGATEKAVARLTEALGHKDPELRAEAASGLVHMAGGNAPPEAKTAVPALIQALKVKQVGQSAMYDNARTAVISALGEIGPDAKEALPALMALLKEDDQWTRDRASEAIKKIAPNP